MRQNNNYVQNTETEASAYDLDHFIQPIFKEDGLIKVDLNLLPSVIVSEANLPTATIFHFNRGCQGRGCKDSQVLFTSLQLPKSNFH